jgi:hypothetical protein
MQSSLSLVCVPGATRFGVEDQYAFILFAPEMERSKERDCIKQL